LNHQDGPDFHYNYGKRFVFQGHENGVSGKAYVNRINLDADGLHRVTLLATADVNGTRLPANRSWRMRRRSSVLKTAYSVLDQTLPNSFLMRPAIRTC